MVATAPHSVIMVFWKETAFPCWRAMERRWNKKVVSLIIIIIIIIIFFALGSIDPEG